MTVTDTIDAVTLPSEAVVELRQRLADEIELTARITAGVRERLAVDELREDREMVRYRIVGLVEQHVGRPA